MSGPDGVLSVKGLLRLDGDRQWFDRDSAADWMLSYWRGKCRGPALPGRRDIDMVEIRPDILPDLFLIDIARGGDRERYRYRLIGTRMAELADHDPTGSHVDEFIDPSRIAEMHAWLDRVVAEPAPWLYSAPLAFKHRDWKWSWRLSLPLSGDGKTVDMLLLHYTLGMLPPASI
jgi:hypothetical protein